MDFLAFFYGGFGMEDLSFLAQRISFRVLWIRLLENMGAPIGLLDMERGVLAGLRKRFECGVKGKDGVLCGECC